MYIIIIGAGGIGYYLAQLLLEEENDVVVIDKSAEKCDKISQELDIVATQGDGTDPQVLEKAGVKEADAVIALTGQDDTNMIISLLAKKLGAKQVASRIGKVDYDEEMLKSLNIDIVIHPEAAAAGYIAELITKPDVLDLAFISRGSAEIMEVKVTEKSKIAGKKVSEIEHPPGSAIVALFEGKKLIIPDEQTLIKPGQKILILTKREMAEQVRKIL